MNNIPMRTGVKVVKPDDPMQDAVGTTVDRFDNGDVLVEFADGQRLRFAEADLVVL